MIKPIFIILTLAGFASGAEFEVTDMLSVVSTAVFSGSVGIGTSSVGGAQLAVIGSTETAYVITAGTSTAYSFVVSTAGNVNIAGTLTAGTFSASTVSVSGSITANGIQDTEKNASMFMSSTTAGKTLDYMEYSTDAGAQSAYVTNDTTSEATQSNTTGTGVMGSVINGSLGQGFKVSTTAPIVKFTAKLLKNNSPTGTLTCYIYNDSGGTPNNPVATFSSMNIADLATSFTDYNFAGTFTPAANTQYWMVFVWTGGSSGSFQIQDTNPSSYTDGYDAYTAGGVWYLNTSNDSVFKVWQSKPVLQSYSESTIKTQGAYSLKGIATTDALSKTLTRTIASSYINLSGQAQIKFDIYASRTGSNITLGLHDRGSVTTSTTPYVTSINTWQPVTWDISKVLDGNKDAMDQIIITIADAGADNTFYIDNMYSPNSGNDILFTTAGSEKMKIDTSGNVGVGTSDPGAKLDVNGDVKVTGDIRVGNSAADCAGTTAGSIRYNTANNSLEFCDGYSWIVVKEGAFICGTRTVNDVEGSTYNTVQIGGQCWMKENIRTIHYPDGSSITKGPTGSSGWGSDNSYYSCPPGTIGGEDCAAAGGTDKFGMLYQWSAAMHASITEGAQGICPPGWHIPTDAEYKTLETYLGMCSGAGTGCVDASGWRGTDQGTQLKSGGSSGFEGLLSGYRDTGGAYDDRGTTAIFWSSSQGAAGSAWQRHLSVSNPAVRRATDNMPYGFSVRCIKD